MTGELNPNHQSSWPTTAQLEQTTLVFGGSFNPARLDRERSRTAAKRAGRLLLLAIISLGAIGLALSAGAGWQQRNWWFLLERSPYNLSLYTGLLLLGYLWAQTRQQRLDQQKLNLLRWDDDAARPLRLDIYGLFNGAAKLCWNQAAALAQKRDKTNNQGGEVKVSAIDLMLALLADQSVQTLFYRLSVAPKDLSLFLSNYSQLAGGITDGELNQIPFAAFTESLKLHNKAVDPLMLVCALKLELSEDHVLQGVFFNLDVSLEDLEIACGWIFNLELFQEEIKLIRQLSRFKPKTGGNRGLTALPTPYLNRYSRDLTALAGYGALPLALGRGRDLQEIFKLLSAGKNNILIKGPSGTGRNTLIYELAYKMCTEQVPGSLSDTRLVELETAAVLGGSQRAEQVLVRALREAENSGNLAVVIPNIEQLAKTLASTGESLLEILVDFLAGSQLQVLATTTNENYTDYLRKIANFDQVFTSYELKTLSRGDVLLACCVKASLLEYKNRCVFRYATIKQAVELTDLYIKDAGQPQKAIAVLVEAAARTKAQKNGVIGVPLIQTIISEKTHIPSQTLNQDESEKLLRLEEDLAKYIIGQKAALTAVAEGLRRARSGLGADNRPLASFLFLGPTGVGKTEVARVLSKIYFGEEKFLLRLDMSEYQSETGLEKLTGTPGAKADSALIKHLKNYPFCLLLCDEFEKASPQVLNLFLQILEDGRLTSGSGELIDLTHALIIATSNAGSAEIQTGLKAGNSLDRIKARLLDELLLKSYPPELLNRFDGVIIFGTLSPENVVAVVHLQLEALKQQLKAKGIKIDFSAAVAGDIAQKAYDPSLGARPIRRYIQDHIEPFIAKLILQKTLARGSELNLDIQDGRLVIV